MALQDAKDPHVRRPDPFYNALELVKKDGKVVSLTRRWRVECMQRVSNIALLMICTESMSVS